MLSDAGCQDVDGLLVLPQRHKKFHLLPDVLQLLGIDGAQGR